jgi:hypothetical protein
MPTLAQLSDPKLLEASTSGRHTLHQVNGKGDTNINRGSVVRQGLDPNAYQSDCCRVMIGLFCCYQG